MRRWARRLGIAVLALVVALTLASLAYNAVTRHRDVPASKLYRGPSVIVDGTRLAYERWGTHGTPVVLLGGFVEPAWIWDRTAHVLARRHRVFAVDLPPFGYSERRGPYTLARWAELVRGFEQRLGLVRPLVVGHSLGAAVAVSVAADASGIVLLDGDALPGGSGAGRLSQLLQPPWYTSLYRIVTGSDFVFRRGLDGAWGPHPPHFDDAALDAWQRPFRVAGTAAAFTSMLQYGIQGVPEQTLRAVRTPRVVVWGADDSVDSPAAGRRTATLLHARFVSIPGAGHLSMLAAPRAVAAAIDEFARRAKS
jgi:pimeloyl-ACP methyl ester carboxylesterase